jgi:stage III sporulation protein SpoIIIAA
LDVLLDVLPSNIRHAVEKANNSDKLLEIVIDLGRVPAARFVEGEIVLSDKEISRAEIDHITERIGKFDADNRAGM